jgi:hypothetical protein
MVPVNSASMDKEGEYKWGRCSGTMLSLDGYIAGPGDDMGWVFGVDGGPGQTADEVLRSAGALLVGRRTQDVEDRLKPGFYGGGFRGRSLCCATTRRRNPLS